MTKIRLGFLVSHRGSNMQAVINACNSGSLNAFPAVVITNNASCQALQRARNESIPTYIANSDTCVDSGRSPDEFIAGLLVEHRVDLVILAGYMKKVGPAVLTRFSGRIINIHPSLLPKYGGKGMYGLRVHEAVLAAHDKVTGATVHLVDEDYDQGPILAQEKVSVQANDTAETLAERVLVVEHKLFVNTLIRVISGEIPSRLGQG